MKKHIKLLIVLVILFILGYLSFSHADRMWDNNTTVTEAASDPLTNLASETEPAWVSSPHRVSRGDWKFSVSYHSDSDQNFAVVFSMREMENNAPAGSKAKNLAVIPLSQNASVAEGTVHFDEGMTDICIAVYHTAGNITLDNFQFTDLTKYNDKYFACLFLILGAIIIYAVNSRNKNSDDRRNGIIFDILLITAVYTSVPYLNNFLPDAQDMAFHITRIEGIATSLRNGHYPSWISMSGAYYIGYADPVMYPRVFLYIPAILICLGMSPMNAYKAFIFLINLASAFIAYYSFEKLFHSKSVGLVTAIAYNLCLYRLIDIYTRGALGELLAAVFLPLVFYGMYEVCLGNEKKWMILALGLTGILFSHILMTVFTVMFMVLYFILLIPKMIHSHFVKRFFAIIKAGFVTLLLNLYFLIPFLQFYRNEDFRIFHRGTGSELSGKAGYLSQMFSVFVTADSEKGCIGLGSTKDEMALSIGWLIPLCCILFAIMISIGRNTLKKKTDSRIDGDIELGKYTLCGTIFSIYLSSDLFPWDQIDNIPILNILCGIQFPWRFLAMAQLFGTIVIGCVLQILICYKPNSKRILVSTITAFAFFCSVYYIESVGENITIADRSLAGYVYTDDSYRYTVPDENTAGDYYYYLGISSSVDQTIIDNLERRDTTLTFHYSLPEGQNEATLTIPLYGYPGYRVLLNNQPVQYTRDEWGMMQVSVTTTEADVVIEYQGFIVWKIAYVISYAAGILLIMIAIQKRLKYIYKRNSKNIDKKSMVN